VSADCHPRALAQRDGGARPAFAGGAEGGERCWHRGNGGAISPSFLNR
jgi:hypothetical protein